MAQTVEIVNGSSSPGMLRIVLGWILCLLLAILFLMMGSMKLLSRPVMVQEFNQVGLGQWFRYFTGSLEVIGGAGLLVPKFSRWAALLLAFVMIGALVAHFTVLHSSPVLAFISLMLAVLIAWLRR
jgi:putative oxidoreductase